MDGYRSARSTYKEETLRFRGRETAFIRHEVESRGRGTRSRIRPLHLVEEQVDLFLHREDVAGLTLLDLVIRDAPPPVVRLAFAPKQPARWCRSLHRGARLGLVDSGGRCNAVGRAFGLRDGRGGGLGGRWSGPTRLQ